MNPTYKGGLLAVAFGVCAIAGPAAAAQPPKFVLPEAARTVEGGRKVQILVAQSELRSNINASNLTVAAGGGLLVALIDAKIEADRAKRAEVAITPLRAAMTGFNTDDLAKATTKAILDKTPWLNAVSTDFGRDNSVDGLMSVLDASPTGQVAFFDYVYDTSPDFSSVRVSLTIRIADKTVPAGKKPDARLAPKNLIYSQTVTSVVNLNGVPSRDLTENAGKWTADDAKLARQALTQAFEETGELAIKGLPLTQNDFKAMWNRKDKKWTTVSGFTGRPQEDGDNGVLLAMATGGLVRVETLPAQ